MAHQKLDSEKYFEEEEMKALNFDPTLEDPMSKNLDRAIFLGFFCISLIATLLISGAFKG